MSDEPDLVAVLLRRWRVMVGFVLLGAGIGIAYSMLAPEWFSATLTVVPSQRSQDAAAAQLASRLPGLDSMPTDVQRIQAVLTSNSVADEVIDKFSLTERYDVGHREQARAVLWQHCATAVNRKSGVVSLSCEDQDPKTAMAITKYFGEVGNRVFGRVSASSAREERKFLEVQVVKARQDVDEASKKLREFQEQHKLVDLPEQSKAVISAMASIQGNLISKQLELSYLKGFSSANEASVLQLRQQIDIMQAKLSQLEATQQDAQKVGTGSAGSGSQSFFPGAMRVPELRFELEQLIREQKIKETLFFLMTQRYEVAKVDEARDTSTFQILDNPTLPTLRARPQRRKIVMMAVLASLAAAAIWILVPVWWRRRNVIAT
jgi:tyrosine-protein kinase Etk/Wzc